MIGLGLGLGLLFQDFTQVGSGGKFQVPKFNGRGQNVMENNQILRKKGSKLNPNGDKKVVNVDLF